MIKIFYNKRNIYVKSKKLFLLFTSNENRFEKVAF